MISNTKRVRTLDNDHNNEWRADFEENQHFHSKNRLYKFISESSSIHLVNAYLTSFCS